MMHIAPARVTLDSLRLRACVGVTERERDQPQTLHCTCSVSLSHDFDPSQDAIEATVDYSSLAKTLRAAARATGARLLERLAWELGSAVLQGFPAASGVTIRLSKTGRIPECSSAGVEITLSR
ncbi:MAG: dihydroneopterin aldolase [Spirochaetaceae bacterium]